MTHWQLKLLCIKFREWPIEILKFISKNGKWPIPWFAHPYHCMCLLPFIKCIYFLNVSYAQGGWELYMGMVPTIFLKPNSRFLKFFPKVWRLNSRYFFFSDQPTCWKVRRKQKFDRCDFPKITYLYANATCLLTANIRLHIVMSVVNHREWFNEKYQW